MPDDLTSGTVPVSAADTDGLEQQTADEFAAGEAALLGIVAAAVLAGITGTVTDRLTGLSTLRRKLREQVNRIVRRGGAAAQKAMDQAATVGQGRARRTLAALSRRRRPVSTPTPAAPAAAIPSPAPAPLPHSTPASPAPTSPLPTVPLPGQQPAHGPNVSPSGTGGLLSMPVGQNGAQARVSLADLRATAPLGPRGPRGVTIRTPDPLIPQLQAMAPQMVRAAEGLYQQVLTQVLADPMRSDAQRLRLAQQLLDRAASKGLTGYIDGRKRKWSMVSYVEMATRTAAARSAIDAHTALIAANGYDLVRVSVHPNCSNLCAPFQGNLLSVTGMTGNDGPEPWRRRVVASLAEARARGFNHPNCKHFVQLWIPGDALPEAPEVDPANYKAEQHLRGLERTLRAARRRQAVALDDAARRKAAVRITELRKQIAQHVAEHPTVVRKPHREKYGTAL